MNQTALVFLAGLLAGTLNAAAGGGTFVSVLGLIYAGVPSVSANMSSTIALYPGSLASGWAYRKHFRTVLGIAVWAFLLSTLAGGAAGALLLLYTPEASFDRIVPWLLLAGSVVFAMGPMLGQKLQHVFRPTASVVLVVQFLLGIYGGYFGGAVGIVMMAFWSILGLSEIRSLNATKVVLVAAANTVAVVFFVASGTIAWRETFIMGAAAAVGGQIGTRTALRIDPVKLRVGAVILNFMLTAALFYSRYF